MSDPLIIIVTGSNRGIGKGIVSLLGKQNLTRPLVIYATSRIATDTGIEVAGPNKVHYSALDITDSSSIRSFFAQVLEAHKAIDVLINNAAVSNDYRETSDLAAQTIWNNYGGTRDMCATFLAQPDLPPGARIVNLTSGLNALSSYKREIQDRFRAASSISDIDAIAKAYLADMVKGSVSWATGARSYKISKALINTLTVVLSLRYSNVLVNCCCPGWTNTEMGKQGGPEPPKTPEEGAMTAVRLAIGNLGPGGDADGGLGRETEKLSGMFYENDNIMAAGWGRGKRWMET